VVERPADRAAHTVRARKTPDWTRVTGIRHHDPSVVLSTVEMSPKATAMPRLTKLLRTCMAMPASMPPVAITQMPAAIEFGNVRLGEGFRESYRLS